VLRGDAGDAGGASGPRYRLRLDRKQ